MRLFSWAIVAVAAATPSTCEYMANRPPLGTPSPVVSASPSIKPSPIPAPSPNDANREAAQDAFDRYDLDKSKTLNETEYVAGRYGDVRFFKAPTEAEVVHMKRGFSDLFGKLDVDKDKALTFSEFFAGYGT